MSQIEQKLQELEYPLPEVAKPVAAYVPAVKTGNLVMTSGQLPMVKGELRVTGKVGDNGVPVDQAAVGAKICLLNALAAVKGVIEDLDQIKRIVRVCVYVQSEDDFTAQPQVANGASVFLEQVFGKEKGTHIRSAVGVNALPLNASVEVELVVEV